MKNKDDFSVELEKRIAEIESYSDEGHFSRKDYIVVGIIAVLCLGFVVFRAFL